MPVLRREQHFGKAEVEPENQRFTNGIATTQTACEQCQNAKRHTDKQFPRRNGRVSAETSQFEKGQRRCFSHCPAKNGRKNKKRLVMQKILIINGPNLNLLGKRETEIYGSKSFDTQLVDLQRLYPTLSIDYFQSNSEGAIIDKIQASDEKYAAIVINGGAYTHTSIAIADAIRAIAIPVIEVHISNIYAREEYRKNSFLTPVCKGSISGLGMDGYRLAIEHIINN